MKQTIPGLKSLSLALLAPLLVAPLRAQQLLYEISGFGSIGTVDDLDGDGVNEIRIAKRVFSGTDGAFVFDLSVPAPAGYGSSFPIGDIDGDGYPDIVFRPSSFVFGLTPFAVYSGLTKEFLGEAEPAGWFSGLDDWTWVEGEQDVNGDGVADLVYGNEVSTVLGNVVTGYLSGAAIEPGVTSSVGAHAFLDPGPPGLVGDFNGDGVADGLFRDWFSAVSIKSYAQGGVQQLGSFSYYGFLRGVADVDGDGLDDKIGTVDPNMADIPGPIEVLSGATQTVLLTVPGSYVRAAGVGDADCDGAEDFLAVSAAPPATLLLSGTDGSVLWQAAVSASHLGPVGDVNSDGRGDWAIGVGGKTQVWASPPPTTTTYCTGKLNSAGCTPGIQTSGLPTAGGPDDFLITARDVLVGTPGLFFWGTSGPAAIPFLGGTLCVQPSLQRGPPLASSGPGDCDAGYAFLFSQSVALQYGITPGTTVNGQFWMRDPQSPDGTGVALSNGVEFRWCGP